MKHIKLYELFTSNDVYDVILDKKGKYEFTEDTEFYKYHFITKDGVYYDVVLEIGGNEGDLNFHTRSVNNDNRYNSSINLINTHDSIKVFNTIMSIIKEHKKIRILKISSTEDRINFYKKMVNYMKYEILEEEEDELKVRIR